MRFSHRLFLLLILLLTGAPILAQEPSDVAKNVRMMVSGIVSYTRWPALSGPPKLCIFSSSRFSTALQENAATSLPYLPVIIHTQQEAMISGCNGFYFGNESPTFQMELTEQYPSKALLLIAEQNTECENIALSAKQTAFERCDELSAIAQSNREKVAASVIKEICGK